MLQTSERGNSSELIRDVNQVQLVVHDNPEADMKVRPWRWQSFGLHPSALMGKHWAALQERRQACDLDWLCRSAQQKKEQGEEDDHRLPIIYEWPPITAPAEIPGALLLAMPHQLVTYDKNLGLVFLDGRIALPEAWRRCLEAQIYRKAIPRARGALRRSGA